MDELTDLERKKKAGKKLSGAEEVEYDSFTAKERKRVLMLEKIRRNLKQLEEDIGELVTLTKIEEHEWFTDVTKEVK